VQYNSPVILTFFLLSLGVLFLGQYTGGWTTTHLFSVYRSSLKDPLFYIRLFGHVLGHGSWDHFLNNMLLLLVVGPPMEEKYGSLPPPLSVNLFTSCRVLGMKVDEAFPDTLYVIGTVALMAILTFTIPGLAEFLPAVLGG